MTTIELKGYNLENDLENDQDIIDELVDYSGDSYVCDAVSEIANGAVPIYNSELWEGAAKISDYIESAIEQGLVDTSNVDLMQIFRAGFYEYYSTVLGQNLDEFAFNYVAKQVNEFIATLEEFEKAKIHIDSIEEKIEDQTTNFDHNDTFNDLDDIVNDMIDQIKEQIEQEDEEGEE